MKAVFLSIFAVLFLSADGTCGNLTIPHGPEAWLEFMGGNVRKGGLRCDLEAIKKATGTDPS